MAGPKMLLDPAKMGSEAENLEEDLRKRIVGQDDAVRQIVDMYQTFLAGMATPGKPVGTLLFLGPTGTGKTHTVEAARRKSGGRPAGGGQDRLRRVPAQPRNRQADRIASRIPGPSRDAPASSEGSYDGTDIIPEAIKWCTKKISREYPRFCFHFADIYSKKYNPRGRVKASDYAFPFDKDSFDFAILVSVFTHMLPEDMEHYISEVAHLLKPGGTCFATYFLLNPKTLEDIETRKSAFDFQFRGDRCRMVSCGSSRSSRRIR